MITANRLYQINTSRILQHIRANRDISRIAIAKDLGLDRSTITKVVRQLMEIGLVRTTEKYHDETWAGRKATGLEINPHFGLVLGIEAQTEIFRTVLVNLDGETVGTGRYPYDCAGESLEGRILAIIAEAKERCADIGSPLVGVGIGLSGIVDPYRGEIVYSNPLGIQEPLALGEKLAAKTDLPVFLENDANCGCWGEMAFNGATNGRNFLSLLGEFRNIDISANRKSGVAFGIGVVIKGSVLHGDSFTAGEFRSLRYDHNRPSHTQFSITDEEASRLPGDRDILLRVFEEIAYNVSLLVNIFDITKLVVTGDFARFPDLFAPILQREIQRNWLYQTEKKCAVEFSDAGENAVCLGAAGLFIQKLFTVPDMTDHIEEEVGSILLERLLARLNAPVAGD